MRTVGLKLKNGLYIIKKSWAYDRKYVVLALVLTLLVTLQPFIAIMIPKLIIDELTGDNTAQQLIRLICYSGVLLFIVHFLVSYIENKNNCLKIVYGFLREYTRVNLTTDYTNIENPQFLNKTTTARMTIYSVVNTYLPQVSSFISNMFIFLGYAAIIITLHPLIFVLNLGMAAVLLFFNDRAKKYHYSQQEAISEQDRHKDVLKSMMNDFSYGKDIRIFNFSSLIIEKYNLVRMKRYYLAESTSKSTTIFN